MKLMEDSPERREIIKKMVAIVIKDSPWIFCTHRIRFNVNHGWLKNYTYHSLGSNYCKYYRIDETAKKELKKKL